MKNKFFVYALVILTLGGCKKSATDNTSPVFDGKTCKVMNFVSTYNGYTDSAIYIYNSSGKLIQELDFDKTGDTILNKNYSYSGNLVQYSTSLFPSPTVIDSVYYTYDNQSRIISTLEREIAGTTLMTTKKYFYYNTLSQVVMTVSRRTIDSTHFIIDSILYTYNSSNITKFIEYYYGGVGPWQTINVDITYDNMKNYYKALGCPFDSYYYWAENNIVEMKELISSTTVLKVTFLKYNSSGYPTEFSSVDYSSPQHSQNNSLTFQCQ
jgi:hypothetical protein